MTIRDSQELVTNVDGPPPRTTQVVVLLAAAYATFGSITTLLGWVLDIPRLTDWNNDGISMFPNTAMLAIMGAISLAVSELWGRRPTAVAVSRVLAVCIAVVAGLTLFEHFTDISVGIDTLLFDKEWGQRASTAPMRMGPPATVSFLILSAALFLLTLHSDARHVSSDLALLVVAIASLSLIGYWFGADQLFGIARITGIAWQTSITLVVLSIGVMAAVPEHGIVAALHRDDAGGSVFRRLILPIIALPLLLGWMRVLGQEVGLYDVAFGTAVRSLVEVVLLLGLLWWTADGISRHSRAARVAEDAARRADRRKDEFLATLAHELRNPLAPIGNALELIKHVENDPELLRQSRETMQRQFSHMVRLVDDLLDVSRITRDKLDLRKERIELQSVIRQAVETSRSMPEAGGKQLDVGLPSLSMWIEADSVRLTQVFSNLLNNACKFTESGGKVDVNAELRDGMAVVIIRDTGIGISEDQLSSIFEMFAQVDKTLEKTRGGLGIGLTLVKRLIELHGGNVRAESKGLGQGSEFKVELPVLEEELPAMQPLEPLAKSPRSRARRILITDDNRDAANSLALLLKLGGHEVEKSYDGLDAVRKAAAYRPDLILLDIGMPGMNGYEVCRTIRSEPWGRDIQIVAVTGWGQEQDHRNTKEAGFDHHLVKPVSASTLDEILLAMAPE